MDDFAAITRLCGTRDDSAITACDRIRAGRNSRTYKVTCADGTRFAAKCYETRHGAARLATEFDAFTLLRGLGVDQVPDAIARDEHEGLALYEYIDGLPAADRIEDTDIDAAIRFLVQLDALGPRAAHWTSPAVEAVHTLAAIPVAIRQRIAGLRDVQHPALQDFLSRELEPLLAAIETWVAPALAAGPLDPAQRILSPSDFGFHNAIRRADDTLVFLDFEYFGWDHPLKLVADFLLHPAMALNDTQRTHFVTGMTQQLRDGEARLAQLPAAHALFGVKWCTILLNEFLPDARERRDFAGHADMKGDLLGNQLDKARAMHAHIAATYREFPYRA